MLGELTGEEDWGLVRRSFSWGTLRTSAISGSEECRMVSRDNKPGNAEVARPCFGLKAGALLSGPCTGDWTVVKARGRVVELVTENTPFS